MIPFFYFHMTYLGDATLVGRVGEEQAAEERDLATAGACVLAVVPGGALPPDPAQEPKLELFVVVPSVAAVPGF